MKDDLSEIRSEILIYQTEDGRTRIDVRLEDETVWLSQKLMTISVKHIYYQPLMSDLWK